MKRRTVLLFTTPLPNVFPGISTGLLQIATECRKKGLNTKILDLATVFDGFFVTNWKEFVIKNIQGMSGKELFVGINATSPGIIEALELVNLIKGIHKDCTICMGGAHFHTDKVFLKKEETKYCDWVAHGTILDINSFTNAIIHEKYPEKVPNMSFRRNNSVKFSDISQNSNQIIKLPDIDYSFINNNNYSFGLKEVREIYHPGQIIQMSTAVGCNHDCSFCVTGSKGQRIDYVIDEIEKGIVQNVNNNKRFIFFDDPTFTGDRNRTVNILKILKGYNIEWGCQTRVDRVDESLIKLMKDSGCLYIYYGIESGSSKLKRLINKNISNELITKLIKITSDSGIIVGLSFMFGIPEETEEDIGCSIKLLKDLDNVSSNLKFSPSFYAVYPGTPAAHHYEQTGKKLDYFNVKYSREKIWLSYDDGYGACHVKDHLYAEKIYANLLECLSNTSIEFIN